MAGGTPSTRTEEIDTVATIIAPAKLSPVDGFAIVCDHCAPRVTDIPGTSREGYVLLEAWDDMGAYEFWARCFYCNHRDRDQSICSCH